MPGMAAAGGQAGLRPGLDLRGLRRAGPALTSTYGQGRAYAYASHDVDQRYSYS